MSKKNSKWNTYICPNHPLQKWLVEAYKWITMPSGPGPTFPEARLAWMSHTMETSWSPKSFRHCAGKLTKFGKTLLQCHVLLCSAWSTLGKDCNLLDTLKTWCGWTSRQVLAFKFFKFTDQIFTKHILCAKPFPRILGYSSGQKASYSTPYSLIFTPSSHNNNHALPSGLTGEIKRHYSPKTLSYKGNVQ